MENNEKLDYIKEQIEKNSPQLPEKLSKENIVSRLNKENGVKVKSFTPQKAFAMVASLVIVVVATVAGLKMSGSLNLADSQKSGMSLEQVDETHSENQIDEISQVNDESNTIEDTTEKADDYSDIIEHFSNLSEVDVYTYNSVAQVDGISSDAQTFTTVAAKEEKSMDAAPIASFGDTNMQVDGVDEGDILENDGTYLYILTNENKLKIIRASDLKVMSALDFSNEKSSSYYLSDIYVKGDRLVLIFNHHIFRLFNDYYIADDIVASTTFPEKNVQDDTKEEKNANIKTNSEYTEVKVYDISNREAPKEIFAHNQDGNYSTSRLTGDYLYLISTYWVNSGDAENIDDVCIPKLNGEKIPRSKIEFNKNDQSGTYTIISSLNVTENEVESDSYAYLGNNDNFYCDINTLYIASSQWLKEGEKTTIFSFNLNDGKITKSAEGSVEGYVSDQFSMDEFEDKLRIVTTNRDDEGESNVSIYVLDSSMNELGKLENIAGDEDVQSVRFMGETAYVVTFRNTDPLFVIDLSNPEKPVVLGEVKLPGFSSYLHSIDDRYVVGVGYDGDDESADYDSIKITLFDISDKKNPKVADEYVLKGLNSDAQTNFKAFMYYPEKRIIGVPCRKWYYDGDKDEVATFFVTLTVKDGKLQLVNKISFNKDTYYFEEEYHDMDELVRGTYIGENLYLINNSKISSYNINNGEQTNTRVFSEAN